jgi:hypothetical protein
VNLICERETDESGERESQINLILHVILKPMFPTV